MSRGSPTFPDLGFGCGLEVVAKPWAHLWTAAPANPSSFAAYFLAKDHHDAELVLQGCGEFEIDVQCINYT